VEVHEYDSLRDVTGWVLSNGVRYSCEKWSDIITLSGAQPLAAYDFEFYAGTPAITENSYGKGTAYYVGTEPGPELAARFIDQLIQKHKLCSLGETPDEVELAHRVGEGKDYIFVINHSDAEKHITIPEDWKPYYEDQCSTIKPFSADVYTI
jgi:beta-galactosidase